jgi:hypothetical protein
MKKFALGLISAAALATTILLVRQQREVETKGPKLASSDGQTTNLSIERIRELGL